MDVQEEKNKNVNDVKKYVADLKEQVREADSRCGTLKAKLQYMKMLYNDIRPENEEDLSPSRKTSSSATPVNGFHNDITAIFQETSYSDYLGNIPEIKCVPKEDMECSTYHTCLSSKFVVVTSRIDKSFTKEDTIDASKKNVQNKFKISTPRNYTYPSSNFDFSREMSSIYEEDMSNEECDTLQNSYQNSSLECIAESPQDTEDINVSEHENKYVLQDFPSANIDTSVNISGNIRNSEIIKHKNSLRHDRREKVIYTTSNKNYPPNKIDSSILSKLKKRKGKLRCAASKSTVATKDTNFARRKVSKKRKLKSGSNWSISGSKQAHRGAKEVVEIYHNIATKSGSTSIMSSKHSKLDRQSHCIRKPIFTPKIQPNKLAWGKRENNNYQHNRDIGQKNQRDGPPDSSQTKKKEEVKNLHGSQDYKSADMTQPISTLDKCNSRQANQCAIIKPAYCNSLITHNYEMPTLASKLKQANRSYFTRFNFRNIPFVVGTSVTPSHNLGLNIQQVLSIMKTRQTRINGINPLIIRKVSKGMRPIAVLMEQINEDYVKESDVNSRVMSCDMKPMQSSFLENEETSNKNDQKFVKEDQNESDKCGDFRKRKDTISENRLNEGGLLTPKSAANVKPIKPFSSQQNIKNRGDHAANEISGSRQSSISSRNFYGLPSTTEQSQGSKGIREVLVNLHDQFEEMNEKYEILKTKAEKSEDKNLNKEIVGMEKDLNAKEDEINAVVNLYKEVMALKQQMKALQDKNSYVCVSTDGGNFHQTFQRRRGNAVPSVREPSTSVRLTGLLRQIQTFQKQLKFP